MSLTTFSTLLPSSETPPQIFSFSLLYVTNSLAKTRLVVNKCEVSSPMTFSNLGNDEPLIVNFWSGPQCWSWVLWKVLKINSNFAVKRLCWEVIGQSSMADRLDGKHPNSVIKVTPVVPGLNLGEPTLPQFRRDNLPDYFVHFSRGNHCFGVSQ